MPGVCAVLESSELAGITRTPSCFHLASLIAVPLSEWPSLPTPRCAREAARFFGGAEQGLGLVDAFALLGRRVRIGDDAGAGLHVHRAVLDECRAQHDRGVHLAGGGEIADGPRVE